MKRIAIVGIVALSLAACAGKTVTPPAPGNDTYEPERPRTDGPCHDGTYPKGLEKCR